MKPVFVLGINGAANCGKTFYTKIFKKSAEKNGLKVGVLKEVKKICSNI